MKLLLDQGLPRSAATLLNQQGHDAVHVGDIGMAAAEDAAILEEGQRTGRTVVTLDADFHKLLALSGAAAPSTIRIRIEGLRAEPLVELLQTILLKTAAALEAGAAVSVEPERVRVRRLPIRRPK